MTERLTWMPPEALGLTEEQVEEVGKMKEAEQSGGWEHITPKFVGIKSQSLDVGRVMREIKLAQANFQEARISQPEARVKINTDLPISIFFVGDVHYGSIYTDHDYFRKIMREIGEMPNAYVAFMSNLIDNGIPSKYPDSMLANAIPPDKQVVVMRKMVQELNEKGRVLGAVTSPCHEGWTYQKCGQEINALIFGFKERKFPVL